MWMPALAAILTCRVLGRPLRSLGLWIFGFGPVSEHRFRAPVGRGTRLGRDRDVRDPDGDDRHAFGRRRRHRSGAAVGLIWAVAISFAQAWLKRDEWPSQACG